jgi:redox-sensitive bicupin YhaK (pirin superfamily)
MEVKLEPDAKFAIPVPSGHTALAYVFEGKGKFGAERETVEAVRMVVFGEGDRIEVETDDDPARFMLIAGAPFKEPIVPYGPFVMNTMEEIQQTLAELRNGTFIRE